MQMEQKIFMRSGKNRMKRERVLNENGPFLTLVKDKCGNAFGEKYLDFIRENNSEQYWEDFGFKYLGVFQGMDSEQILARIELCNAIANKAYVSAIFCALSREEQNADKAKMIKKGQERYAAVSDFSDAEQESLAEAVFIYLADHISKYDEMKVYQLSQKKEVNGWIYNQPVCNKEEQAFGVIYTWPGSISAESELMERIKRAATDVGVKIYWLSDSGNILNDKQLETDQYATGEELQFLITLHYEDNKALDTYYYHVLWNPPEIPLGTDYYDGKVVDNYLMNDDYLIYDAGGMSNHLKSILINKPRNIDEASCFVGSFPGSVVKQPHLENPKLFYCGMNWEKVLNKSNRHEGLFKLLDETDKVCFYGPEEVEAWGGIRPWEGYNCYKGEIPFDGFSILDEINKCGICLAISSDIHRRAGAVTNRAYEACAAGAVIISDNNEFMEKYFKDAVLFINYNKNNPQDTFNQIMEKYQWIVEHPAEALEMAKRSQKIFLENFTMDHQLLKVIENHSKRFETISKDLFAQKEEKFVLIVGVVNTQNEEEACEIADSLIRNMQKQYYRNLSLVLACDETVAKSLQNYVEKKDCRIRVSAQELFDEKGSRKVTDGQALHDIQMNESYDYYIRVKENEVWFYDHITTLVRMFEEQDDIVCAYSGVVFERKDGFKATAAFKKIGASDIYYNGWNDGIVTPGQFMFKRECFAYVPEFVLNCIDGMEHSLYLSLLYFKEHKKFAFSKRMTCRYLYEMRCKEMSVLPKDMQIKYVRGMVKYDLPEGGIGNGNQAVEGVSAAEMAKIWMRIPLKSWLKLRIAQRKWDHADLKTEKGKKIADKYEKRIKEFSEGINSIL